MSRKLLDEVSFKNGNDLTLNEIKSRLIGMDIDFDPNIKIKSYYVDIYNNSIKDLNNRSKILQKFLNENEFVPSQNSQKNLKYREREESPEKIPRKYSKLVSNASIKSIERPDLTIQNQNNQRISSKTNLPERKVSQNNLPERKFSQNNLPERKQSQIDLNERNLIQNDLPERRVSQKDLPERRVSQNNLPERKLSQNNLPERKYSQTNLQAQQKDSLITDSRVNQEANKVKKIKINFSGKKYSSSSSIDEIVKNDNLIYYSNSFCYVPIKTENFNGEILIIVGTCLIVFVTFYYRNSIFSSQFLEFLKSLSHNELENTKYIALMLVLATPLIILGIRNKLIYKQIAQESYFIVRNILHEVQDNQMTYDYIFEDEIVENLSQQFKLHPLTFKSTILPLVKEHIQNENEIKIGFNSKEDKYFWILNI